MFGRIRVTMLASTAAGLLLAGITSTAHAGVLSLAPGSCGYPESQTFLPWSDFSLYVLVPGGAFEPGNAGWLLSGGAKIATGNESYDVSGPGSYSLSLPAGSSATSPYACTGIDHPSMRFFVRNTGALSSRLKVYATYPIVLGLLSDPVYLGEVSGTGTWQPSSKVNLGLLNNTIGSLTLGRSAVSFSFVPADSTGSWSIDDVYLDPTCRW